MPGIHPPLLQLFGEPILRSPGGEFRLRRQQRFRLLAYVAAQGHPVDRDLLGAVFWPDAPPGVARRNLRKTWFDLKQLPQLQGAALQADATTLAWTGDSDLARFQAQLQAGNTRAAIELCSGPLMQGMDGGSDEFQRWLDSERERLAVMFRAVLLPLLPTLPVADLTGALVWVEQLLVADPLDEDAVRAKARLLVAVGRSAAARRCHARWRRQLQAEVGVDAGPDLRAFLDVDSPAAVTARPAAATPASGAQAPAYLSAFVGRGAELRALQTLFVAGERLVTLLGPPGCGKTRLAAVAFERLLLPGTRRRWFVELDRLPAGCGDQFTMHVAAAVGLRLTESERAHELLASFLATEPTLLVLENFEHRQADVPLLRRLMRSAHVRVLATSTVRLGVQGECVFELAGLSTGQHARLLHWTRIDDADRLAAQALAVFERLDDAAGRIAAWRVHAVIAWRRGDTTRALTLFRQALALCDRSGHGGKRAMLLDGLGLALVHRGENDASRTAFAEALEINERTGNGLQRVHNLVNLALDALATAPAQASALARRALTLTRETGFQHYEPHCLTALALAQIAEGNAQGGRSMAEQAVALTRQSGDSYIESWALAALARGCLADQSLDAAADALSRGLKLSWEGRDEALAAQHLALAAQWCLLSGRHGAARVLMVSLLEVSALPAWLRLWLEELGGTRLPPAAQPMPPMTLASLVHATLGELEVTADTGLPGQA